MKRLVLALVAWGLFCPGVGRGAAPVMHVLKPTLSGTELLRNGNFEHSARGKLSDWAPTPNGLSVAEGEGFNSSQGIRCENAKPTDSAGISQTLSLNRTNVFPLTVRGWSKAEEVSGSPDSGYSLYLGIVYQDGTLLRGQTANFRTGTHGWQQQELVILPEKPVKTLTLQCILRGHSGKAWFDDVSLEEVKPKGGVVVFQGVPVALEAQQEAFGSAEGRRRRFATKDGLELGMKGSVVESLRSGREQLAGTAPSGFLVRDVAADSDIYSFSKGRCPGLGLQLQADFRAESNHIVIQGRITDTSGKDRAVTLLFALPIDAHGWHWADDIRHNRVIQGNTEMANDVTVGCGATGTMSLYPLATIYDEKEGLALGLDMAHAAQYRLGYNPGTRQFFIAYDFGLVRETERFPAAAEFRFVLFRFNPKWGFRAAFQKFMEIFPGYFRVRSRQQGIWMPFTNVSTVQGWQDFGFKYHEGNNNVAWDDAHGILSFRYTEPMTWWMSMNKDAPRTTAEALRERDELVASGKGSAQRMAQVSQIAGMQDDSGQPALLFRDTPWCDGAVWSLNPNPNLATVDGPGENRRFNAATVYWNHSVRENLYGLNAKAHQDGEFLDSIEGYVTADLNFRREHFRYTTVPLTFDSDTKKPALFKGLAVFEFTKWISDDVHRLGKLMFANGVPNRFSFLCPWLDVLGTETDWLQNGKYRSASDSQMSLWRTLSGGKPYLLLMNTDYTLFTPELVEIYFQRSLFYGMFPSMFSHNAASKPYWRNPKWYNRDRSLFKKYLPLIKRVAEAGWQPVTLASCDNPKIFVERFGPDAGRNVYFTLLNDTDRGQTCVLRLDPSILGTSYKWKAVDLLSGTEYEEAGTMDIHLDSQQATVIQLLPARSR
jgi:hypothetical protein